MRIFITGIFLISSLLATGVVQAGIYKCQKMSGEISYSDKPCVNAEPLEIPPAALLSGGGSRSASSRVDISSSNEGGSLSGEACVTAINNGKDWIESMREVAKRNLQIGHMSQAEYDYGVRELESFQSELNVSKCRSASGNNKKFFQCLTKVTNHLAVCGRQYKPSL